MIQKMISQYVHTLFDESRNGELIAGDDDNRFDYPVEWDQEAAKHLAQQCSVLIAHLTELSSQYDRLLTETRHLTTEQMDVWNTYLRPFTRHGLNMEALQTIWEKFEIGEPVTEKERALAEQYVHWFEGNALQRLPAKCGDPIQLINRARRYSKLVRLNAPAILQENEAKRLAEEFILYHCMCDKGERKNDA